LAAAQRKGIDLVIESGGLALVLGDPNQVGQILDNFISNALKFSQRGTTVTLGLAQRKGYWRVYFRDQGPGLTEEDLGRVFGEYSRLSARPTAGEASLGLGLSIVKRMAEGMSGTVGVESVFGQGATFWLELPDL
ncbi:MAG: HAMP domain-containing sensor histidine kinase, partial [Holophaga sp.]|nr:HAMP domain-containing sensor histidine kinase [Holophaga sp.]